MSPWCHLGSSRVLSGPLGSSRVLSSLSGEACLLLLALAQRVDDHLAALGAEVEHHLREIAEV